MPFPFAATLGTQRSRVLAITFALAAAALNLTGCASSAATSGGTIRVVAAENEYGNVASQIGGRYVSVTSVESNPNTDPHTYEVSPGVAQAVSAAQVVVQNGIGYDDYMDKIESASSNGRRTVLVVQHLIGLPDSTPNPHLWYSPTTMPKVADALASDFSRLQPGHADYFRANAAAFISSLGPWTAAIAAFKTSHPGAPVATTEPVADYLLEAAGMDNLTPFAFQADVMNGVDPSPQDVTLEAGFFSGHEVKALVYNQQVTDSLTQSFITDAQRAGIPVVGVYETMPTGYDYQSWMLAELNDIAKAVVQGVSTSRL